MTTTNSPEVLIRLHGPLAAAVAVEWTDAADPAAGQGTGPGWQPCLNAGPGTWRLAGLDPETVERLQTAERLENVAIRYRLDPAGPWSPASEDRKEVSLVGQGTEEGDAPPAPVLPVLLAPPALAGSGIVGEPLTVDPGLWSDAAGIALAWCRDGVPIGGATGTTYVPGDADDRTTLTCRVRATNAAGDAEATTAGLAVTQAPPEVVDTLFDEVFDEGTGPQEIATAHAFAGRALVFAADGADAAIDPATGIVTIPTDAPLSGATVTVTAANSGGTVAAAFQVTIEASSEGETPPNTPADGTMSVAQRADSWRGMAAGQPNEALNFGAYTGQIDGRTVVTLAVSPDNLAILRFEGNVPVFDGAALVSVRIGQLEPFDLPWSAGTGSYRATIAGLHMAMAAVVDTDVSVDVEWTDPAASQAPASNPLSSSADVTVTTVNGLLSAMAAVPSNLGRTYVIGVQPGTYGQVDVPSGYNKGSTRVEIRGLSLSNPPVIRGFEAQNSRNLIFRALRFVSIARDVYGFPATNARGLNINDARNIEVNNCEFLHQYIGLVAFRTKDILVQDCTFRASGMDDIRIFQDCERITFRRIHIAIYGPPNAFPLMRDQNNNIWPSASNPYPRDIAIDLRRADKAPFTGDHRYPLENGQMSSTVWTKEQRTHRHPDGIQAAGTTGSWDEILIEDSYFEHHKPIYMMNERGRNTGSNSSPPLPGNKAGQVIVRRCFVACEQALGVSFAGCNDAQVRDTLIRFQQWLAPAWQGSYEARVTANGDATLHCQNVVAPMSISNRNQRNVITSSGYVVSGTAVPTGWSGFSVANGEYGCTWRRGKVRGEP